MPRRAAMLGLLLALGCGARTHGPGTAAAGASANRASAEAAIGRAGACDRGTGASGPRPAPPPAPASGFVRASVEGVVPGAGGTLLLLGDPSRSRVVPVAIGDAEAAVIEMRLRGARLERPLTHDLLDAIVRELGGTVVMVQVDKLRTGVFIASIVVWDGCRAHRIDARTSDAVAVALGHGAPIYVANQVFVEAGVAASCMPSR